MQISDAEWIVMNLIWQSGPIDASQVVERLAKTNDWSPATVKTMLHRLVKKGALSHQANGKKYLYRASVRRHDCIRKASRSFLERVFGGQAAPALLHLVKTSKLSADEVAELRALLDEKELSSK
jgi:BlaI family penicillinase repressor